MAQQVQKVTAVVTSVAIGTPVALDETPLLGGAGKKGILRCPVLPLTSTVLVQGAPAIDAATGIAPVSGSSLWTTLVTLTSASDPQAEIDLPELIRANCTVLDADGPDVEFWVEAQP